MSGITIYTSNRLEILGEQLSLILQTPLRTAFEPEVIVVQSKGMQRWVSLELARHNGICANCRFPFPNRFLKDIGRKLMGDELQTDLFAPGIMVFRIMEMLPACLSLPEFESLALYLGDDADGLKLFQLSEKLADLFDQYLVFRPAMMQNWEKGLEEPLPDVQWQAHLWRELIRGHETGHRANVHDRLIAAIRSATGPVRELPERVSIFGISYLPPSYFQAFAELSRLMQVHVFLMNPCREYWADIMSDREIRKTKQRYGSGFSESELFLEQGNPLLASMGMLGKEFFRRVMETDVEVVPLFEDVRPLDLLTAVQADILHLSGPSADSDEDCAAADDPAHDLSIRIHSCHSPMREIEVLHNQLLDMFERDPQLSPNDIMVMTPDIRTYAPFIQAVFDAQTDPALRIPFSIADQSLRTGSRIVEAFVSILDLKDSRLSATDIMSLLESFHIRSPFGISESDLETVERWVRDTRIRWGIDRHSRTALGLPDVGENTWKAGLERLLLGYAMPGQDRRVFNGVLPYDHIEGNDALLLGRFVRFLDTLFECVSSLKAPRPMARWTECLSGIVDRFFSADPGNLQQIQMLRSAIHQMGLDADAAGFDGPVEFAVMRACLGGYLETESFGSGFISGGVTFCAMLPMRSIPFKVICLIGMNTDAFPRDGRPPAFDLMALRPEPGDRSRRNDDRYLFLEALISARKTLYISYVGQSVQDNSTIPPSVLVSELLDNIRDTYGVSGDRLVTRHRLQSFSPWYFRPESPLFSYSEEDLAAGVTLQERSEAPAAQTFIKTPLPLPDEWKRVDLPRLASFFSNPARFLLRNRLGVYLEAAEDALSEEEDFTLEGLNRYQVHQDLFASRQSGHDLREFFAVEKASGRLPHGAAGEVAYSRVSLETDQFVNTVNRYTNGRHARSVDIRMNIDGFEVSGTLDGGFENRLIDVRFARAKARDLLRVWIDHLAWCGSISGERPPYSYLICRDTIFEYRPVECWEENLISLLELYGTALTRPIAFFPESSYHYARQILRGKSAAEALSAARNKWMGSAYAPAEASDPYLELCFKHTDPLDEEFGELSKAVFLPMLEHMRELKDSEPVSW